MNTNRDLCRQVTENTLMEELLKVKENYMKVYDEYYETGSRDSAFLKDLTDTILGISAVLEVYVRDGEIHPGYAVEKLKHSSYIIESNIKYFNSKLEKEKTEE